MIEQWLHKMLADTSGVTVWPIQAAESAKPPFAVYDRTSTERERTLDGCCGVALGTFTVGLASEGFEETRQISARLAAGLPKFKDDTFGVTVTDAWIEDEIDGEPIEFTGDERPWYTATFTIVLRYSEIN